MKSLNENSISNQTLYFNTLILNVKRNMIDFKESQLLIYLSFC